MRGVRYETRVLVITDDERGAYSKHTEDKRGAYMHNLDKTCITMVCVHV